MGKKEKLEDLLKEYFYWITYINDCFELYKHLRDIQSRYLNQMNLAPAFFQLSQFALLRTALVELAKFFDVDKQNSLNLRKTLRFCEENKFLFKKKKYERLSPEMKGAFVDNDINMDSVLDKCSSRLDEMKENIEKLKKVRDKKLAHLDRNADNYIFCKNGLTENIVKTLIDTVSIICKDLSVCLTGSNHACQSSNVFDVDNLFKKLEEEK